MSINIIPKGLELLFLFFQFIKNHANWFHFWYLTFSFVQPWKELVLSTVKLLTVLHASIKSSLPFSRYFLHLLPTLFNSIQALLDISCISLTGSSHNIFTTVKNHDYLMFFGHNLFVNWLKVSNLIHKCISIGRNNKFFWKKTLHFLQPILCGGTLSCKLSSLLGTVFKLSHSIIKLLLTIVELPLNLSHFPLDLRLWSRICQDFH